MGEEEKKEKKRVVVESLGWLTESSIMPKKHRAIAGVGASSIMELKAQLYRSQEESRKSKEVSGTDLNYHRAKSKISKLDTFSLKNSGVDSRAHKKKLVLTPDLIAEVYQYLHCSPWGYDFSTSDFIDSLSWRDKLELKAVNDGSVSYAALEKKAALYDKLVRGELSDEEDKEKYCVDFFRKSLVQDESQQVQGHDTLATVPPETEDAEDDSSVLFNKKTFGPGRTAGVMDNDEHKRFVREVHEEANQAREEVSELKLRRQEQAMARREKLKQAYLRKQLEKLKAASKTEQT